MRLVTAFALAVLAGCPGCYPGLAWLPDSSGFVYTGGPDHDHLLLFDVKTQKTRVVARGVGGQAWPAVSPDGQRIALARVRDAGDARTLTVRVLDLKGVVLHTSRPLPWNDKASQTKDAENRRYLPQVCWSPRGDRLLLYRLGKAALYDPKSGKLTPVPGSLLTLGNRQSAPGNKAFLTTSGKGLALVEWDGQTRLFKWTKRREGDTAFETDEPTEVVLALTVSRWDGDVGRVYPLEKALREGWRVDAAKRVLGRDAYDGLTAFTFANGAKLRWLKKGDDNGDCRLELLRRGANKPEVVADGGLPQVFPSPNGKWVAVGWFVRGNGDGERPPLQLPRALALFDSTGKVVKRLSDAPK